MASPQIHNGYTKIANELLEHLILDTQASAGELKILLFVIRKTYGFHKKIDRISLSQFMAGTGYRRTNICRMINNLVAKQLLLKKDNYYKFNKNWEQWVVTKRAIGSDQMVTKGSDQMVTYKRKGKDNIQKKDWQTFINTYHIKAKS